jgi:hypothetical protein
MIYAHHSSTDFFYIFLYNFFVFLVFFIFFCYFYIIFLKFLISFLIFYIFIIFLIFFIIFFVFSIYFFKNHGKKALIGVACTSVYMVPLGKQFWPRNHIKIFCLIFNELTFLKRLTIHIQWYLLYYNFLLFFFGIK